MKVALPAVGVMDMLRYHTFGRCRLGIRLWNRDGEEWGYSVVSGNSLLWFTTGDHDDRVVPAHSFKFAGVTGKTNRK
jgi:prolyl oligopeptidase